MAKIKFTKGDDVKLIDQTNKEQVDTLLAAGWTKSKPTKKK